MIRVMIVDDEPISQHYLRGLIPWKEEGYELYPPAYNGEDARKILDAFPVDIALLDVFMPGENGLMLSRYIADHYPRTAMLAISSHDDFDYVREIMKNGASDYILKHRLDEAALRGALTAVSNKLKGIVNSGMETEKRERVASWLFDHGSYPFPPGSGRVAASVGRVSLETLPPESRKMAVSGILSILENEGDGNVFALFREPVFFILCVHLKNVASEKVALDFLVRQNEKNSSDIRLIYKLDYAFQNLPSLAPAFIPGQVRRLLDSFSGAGVFSGLMGITVPVSRRKNITSLLNEGNCAGAELIVHELFDSMDKDDISAKLAVMQNLGEILFEYAEEKHILARFDGLTMWAVQQDLASCERKIRELIRELLDEAGEGRGDSHIREARDFLLDNYAGNVSLEKAAAALAISPSYLSRLYKKETGRSFVDAINRIRVDAAKACIMEGMNLKHTAALCGFGYYNYFIKVFKDHTGVTPSDYPDV